MNEVGDSTRCFVARLAKRLSGAMRWYGYRGWRIVVGAMAIEALLALFFFHGYGTFAPFWIAEFGWSKTSLAAVFSLHRVQTGLMGPLHGWVLQRVSPRRVIALGVVTLGAGLVALSLINSFAQFVCAMLVMAIGASLCGILSLMTVIVNWFDRRRAAALSMVFLGFSLGGLALPFLATCLVTYGWRAVAVIAGIVTVAVGLPIAQIMHRAPEDFGLLPDGLCQCEAPKVNRRPGNSVNTSRTNLKRIIASRAFWLISGGHAFAVAVTTAVMVHFVIFVTEVVGVTITTGASLLAAITVMAAVGQVVGVATGDRCKKQALAAAAMLAHAAGMVMLAVSATPLVVVAAAFIHGLASGVRSPLTAAITAEFFGKHDFSTVSGFSLVIVTIGSIIGPIVVGITADRLGSYSIAFWFLAILALMGAAAYGGLMLPTRGSELARPGAG